MFFKKFKVFLSNFFFRLRVIFFSYIFKKRTGYLAHLSPSLTNLKDKGYYKIEGFYSPEQVDHLNQVFNNVLNNADSKYLEKFSVEKLPGEIKLKHVERTLKSIKSLSCEFFFTLLGTIFNGKITYPTAIFHLVHDGSFPIKKNVEGVSKERISGNYHFDDNKPIMKAIILLDDVDEITGAQTSIIPNSYKDERIKKNYINFQQTIDDKIIKKIIDQNRVFNCFGKKGDVFFIDTRNIHWGDKLKSGYRRLLWLYF